METTEYRLVRDANVHARPITNHNKHGKTETRLELTIVDPKSKFEHVHTFSPRSRVTKHLEMMTAEDLSSRLNGGTYFIIDDQLVDFRDGMYHGWIHDDKAIAKFMEVLGFQYRNALPLHRQSARSRSQSSDQNRIVLRKLWTDEAIIVPNYLAEGANHQAQLSFVWNPFYKTINGAFDLVRVICTNGMIGLTPLLQPKIPLLNRWEEHLDIASRQIQNKIKTMVTTRIEQLVHKPATVADCLLLRKHAFDRLHSVQADDDDEDFEVNRERLMNLMAAVEPMVHLKDIYNPSVFDKMDVAAQLPAHLSMYDAYNIATELRTHTLPVNGSSDRALDKFANKLMFGEDADMTAGTANIGQIKPAAFSSPDRAFFGSLGIAGEVCDLVPRMKQ